MKKYIAVFLLAAAVLPTLGGCAEMNYSDYLSDCRSDLFCVQTEDYEITVACMEREYPFATDGYVGALSKTVEATLTLSQPTDSVVEIYFLEDVPRGGEMSFRSVTGDFYYSRGVTEFPSGRISLRVVRDGKSEDVAATSVKNEKTLSAQEALLSAVEAEKELVTKLTDREFAGEFHVRLLRRDKNYYYVGIVDRNKRTVCLLLDSETGAVMARREKLD